MRSKQILAGTAFVAVAAVAATAVSLMPWQQKRFAGAESDGVSTFLHRQRKLCG